MAENAAIEDSCFGSFGEYDDHIRASGGFDRHANLRAPNLRNSVLPMFDERWVIGPGQLNEDVAAKMRPAFRLASRFLTERYPLRWFAHLCFGDRFRDRAGAYIQGNSFSASHDAIPETREIIHTVGKLVTFMFRLEDDDCHGETRSSRSGLYPHERNCGGHWPPKNRSVEQGHSRPVILLARRWLEYFQRRSQPPDDELYRVWFLLATTLTHEFAHAVNFRLSSASGEPWWLQTDKCNELGWSWENTVVGYGLQNFPNHELRHRFLYQCKMAEYHDSNEREQIMRKFCGSNRTDGSFTVADARGRIATTPAVPAYYFHDYKYNFGEGARPRKYIAARQIIPMKWVTAWFSEEKWQERAQRWQLEGRYTRPSLGNAFVVVYENNGQTGKTFRPLNPDFPVDREILERRARGDHRL